MHLRAPLLFVVIALAPTAAPAVPEADAFSFANILFFSVQIGCNILLGLVALVVLPLINRHYHPQPAVEGL